MKFTAVQMIGTQRSGSNLLRIMLNEIDNVVAPHPPHILERFIPLLTAYGNLFIPENFKLLVQDICSLIAYNPVQWENFNLKENEIIKRCATPSLTNIAKAIYEMYAESKGANIWICKSLSNIHFAGILEAGINPLYIFLYRDGRDVACSFKQAVVGEKHIYHIAKQWQQEQELCIALKNSLGNKRVISVCYEDLITSPKQELLRICDFIGAKYNSACLRYYHSKEAKTTAGSGSMWQNVGHKIISNNYNKYKNELSDDEVMLFEKIAGKTLQALNYNINYPENLSEDLNDTDIIMYNQLNDLLKSKAKQDQKPEDNEKRLMQEALINKIRKKLPAALHGNLYQKIAV